MSAGAVAAGHPAVVEAGLDALREGGSAMDGALAALFMSFVAEPLLTGLLGGGLAAIRANGRVQICDFFSNAPGCADPTAASFPMELVELDFGPTKQSFRIGPGAVAAPGMPEGIVAMHRRYGKLPLSRLAAPAVHAASTGISVTAGFARVNRLLWPIVSREPNTLRLFSKDGEPLAEGDIFRCPALGATLGAFAEDGSAFWREGPLGQALLHAVAGHSLLSSVDLHAARPCFLEPLSVPFRDATVWVAGPPSVGGVLVAQSIARVAHAPPLTQPLSAASLEVLAEALRETEAALGDAFFSDFFEPDFVDRFVGRASAGYTTHLSVVDGHGDAVALTSSLGETAALFLPELGLLVNNFLGEPDVNPPTAPRPAGMRLMTMCCPTLVEHDGWTVAMGSGGSNRIRSAVLQGVVFLVDGKMNASQVVRAPRVHVESGIVRFEAASRAVGVSEAVSVRYPDAVRFEKLAMYFGGLHVAAGRGDRFAGAGDPRRSGAFGQTE